MHITSVEESKSNDTAQSLPRKRKPRISPIELESAAWGRGFDAARETYEGGGVVSVLCGALSGATFMGLVWFAHSLFTH